MLSNCLMLNFDIKLSHNNNNPPSSTCLIDTDYYPLNFKNLSDEILKVCQLYADTEDFFDNEFQNLRDCKHQLKFYEVFEKKISTCIKKYFLAHNLLVLKNFAKLHSENPDKDNFCQNKNHQKKNNDIFEKFFADTKNDFRKCFNDHLLNKESFSKDVFESKDQIQLQKFYIYVLKRILISEEYQKYCFSCMIDQFIQNENSNPNPDQI
ncbi:hypothetical protein GVAV_003407 [Gurleya vavrai]